MISNGHIRKLLLCASIIFFPFSYVYVMFEIRFFLSLSEKLPKKKQHCWSKFCSGPSGGIVERERSIKEVLI